jgi:hypothetical protein
MNSPRRIIAGQNGQPELTEARRTTCVRATASTRHSVFVASLPCFLGHRIVRVFAAADNGRHRFRLIATVRTAANGTWTASIGRGPSRLVVAVYRGSALTEPAYSATTRVIVPSFVRLHVAPSGIGWGGTIHIWGGYIPGAGQQILRLRIGADGYRSTVGIPDLKRDGRFSTTWTFHSGAGLVHYWFSVSTLREADYPYAVGGLSRQRVTVRPG